MVITEIIKILPIVSSHFVPGVGERYLYPSWHQAVCSSEDELLSVVAVW